MNVVEYAKFYDFIKFIFISGFLIFLIIVVLFSPKIFNYMCGVIRTSRLFYLLIALRKKLMSIGSVSSEKFARRK